MQWIKQNYKQLIVLLIFVAILAYFVEKQAATEAKLKESLLLSQQQATDINSLQNTLKLNQQNAEVLADMVRQAQSNRVQPVTNISVQAPSPDAAAANVKNKIDAQDTTLPPAALAEADKTVVATQPDNKDYQVGVYKINTYKNWYVGVGAGVNAGDFYVPVSLQRNFSKSAAVEVQINLDPHKQSVSGGQIMYKRAVNKLFGLF